MNSIYPIPLDGSLVCILLTVRAFAIADYIPFKRSYCVKSSSDWDPCDNIRPCLAPNQSCSPRSTQNNFFSRAVSNVCFLGFGYKLQVKTANETASDARTVDLVASAVLHTLSMSSIYLVHVTAAERPPKWLLLCLYPLDYNGLDYQNSI